MTTVSKRSFATAPFLVGALLLLCALTFYYFAVLKIDYEKTALLDFDPHTDAEEYFAQAKAMLKDGWPSVRIGYDKLPSRYPFGYPALMLPWLKILPEADSVLAPFRTNQTLGLLFLLSVFAFYLYLAMPVTGGCAVLLLATLPGFFTFCRSSLSDISAAALIAWAFMFAYLGLTEERRWKIYLSAIFLGLSLNIRLQSLFFIPLLLAMALFPMGGLRLRWFLHCAAIPIVFALAASPTLMLNYTWFHNPFSTGYEFWVPGIPHLFSIQNIPKNAGMLWAEASARWHAYRVANIFGTGTYFVSPFLLLICLGFLLIKPSRFVICALLSGFCFFSSTTIYRFTDGRFYLPLLILLIAVAVLPVEWAAKKILARKHVTAVCVIFGLFLLSLIGFPSQSGFKPKGGRSQAWDGLHFTTRPNQSTHFVAQRHFLEMFSRQPGVVLSDIDPVQLNALLPEPFVAAPLDGKHRYRFGKIWRYDRLEAVALVKKSLAQSSPVYALFVSTEEMTAAQSRLPAVPRYQWTILNADAKAVILKLTLVASEEQGLL